MITILQALGFLVTTIARLVTGLAITTMEITVLANIFTTLMTFIVWWQKPTDVETCHLFELQTTIETIITKAGADADGQYKETPLDFISRDDWSGSLMWNYYVNILRRLGLFKFNIRYEKPAQRFTTFNFPKPGSRREQFIFLAFTLVYCAFFIGAWDFHFPSNTERTLWRTATLAQAVVTLIVAAHEITMFDQPVMHSEPTRHVQSQESSHAESVAKKLGIGSFRSLWDMPCNNELTGNYPCMDVPLRSILLTTPCCAAYVLCRWCILAEDVTALRNLPASAFLKVEWTPWWPWL